MRFKIEMTDVIPSSADADPTVLPDGGPPIVRPAYLAPVWQSAVHSNRRATAVAHPSRYLCPVVSKN